MILMCIYATPLRHEINSQHRPHPYDLPIQAAWKPDEFSRVLECWAEQHDERRHARVRFSEGFSHNNHYPIHRLVGAANMFDILPASIYPKIVEISQDIKDACCAARKAFRKLPKDNPARQSILGALGRIDKPSLTSKVKHRAKLLTDIVADYFSDIDLVIEQAIKCRNYYVHGTETKIDYSKNSDQLIFFTDTLEFVFSVSELVEACWDIAAWIENRPGYSHPFGRYLASYRERLEALKKLLPEKV